jgi:hypothetical protein
MNLNLTERLRRDELWIDADTYPSLLVTITPSSRREFETVLLVPSDSEVPMQALVQTRHENDAFGAFDSCVYVYGYVPLAFGPVQERAR